MIFLRTLVTIWPQHIKLPQTKAHMVINNPHQHQLLDPLSGNLLSDHDNNPHSANQHRRPNLLSLLPPPLVSISLPQPVVLHLAKVRSVSHSHSRHLVQ